VVVVVDKLLVQQVELVAAVLVEIAVTMALTVL
jgi:hypothetical protein